MKHIKTSWASQMMGCQRKGKEAFERGDSRESCPYTPKPWAMSVTGARNLTKARKQYWLYGYDTAAGIDPVEPN